jgi:hypothetical protein
VWQRGNREDRIPLERLRLQAGSHRSPREGVCVVELASALAGERFSDRPRCVCPVIAALLRSWNDRVSYKDRQRLAPYARRIVDSRSSRQVTVLRRDICLIWAGVDVNGGPLRRFAARLRARLRILFLIGVRPALQLNEGAGEYAARVLFARHGEDVAFAMLDRLLAVAVEDPFGDGLPPAERSEPAPLAAAVAVPAQERVAASIGELVRNAQVPHQDQRRNGSNGNGHAGHVGRRDAGEWDEEQVQHNGADRDDPERDSKAAEQAHLVKS